MRQDYIDWDTYFMGIAYLSGMRSKDPSTQVGACIINKDKRIVGIGYNGLPRGCSDEAFPWERVGALEETKYAYVVHAELNAILNSTQKLDDCTIYVTHFPCNECAKAVVQVGIKTIIYASDKLAHTTMAEVSRKIFAAAGVTVQKQAEFELICKEST